MIDNVSRVLGECVCTFCFDPMFPLSFVTLHWLLCFLSSHLQTEADIGIVLFHITCREFIYFHTLKIRLIFVVRIFEAQYLYSYTMMLKYLGYYAAWSNITRNCSVNHYVWSHSTPSFYNQPKQFQNIFAVWRPWIILSEYINLPEIRSEVSVQQAQSRNLWTVYTSYIHLSWKFSFKSCTHWWWAKC